jgi:hypothetical protein
MNCLDGLGSAARPVLSALAISVSSSHAFTVCEAFERAGAVEHGEARELSATGSAGAVTCSVFARASPPGVEPPRHLSNALENRISRSTILESFRELP